MLQTFLMHTNFRGGKINARSVWKSTSMFFFFFLAKILSRVLKAILLWHYRETQKIRFRKQDLGKKAGEKLFLLEEIRVKNNVNRLPFFKRGIFNNYPNVRADILPRRKYLGFIATYVARILRLRKWMFRYYYRFRDWTRNINLFA